MKKILLKLKLKKYLKLTKKLNKCKEEIESCSKIGLVPGSENNSVQIVSGEAEFFKLIKPRNGDFKPFSKTFRYKHVFNYKGVRLFYLSNDNVDEDKVV